MNNHFVYALDFDGVICDSAIETAISGWKAARLLWSDLATEIPAQILASFRQVRPMIETGYEAVLALRMLASGASIDDVCQHGTEAFPGLMREAGVDSDDLKKLFGEVRDQWIASNPAEWVAKNPLYPGVAEKLHELNRQAVWYVVTTKQERFVKTILQAHDIALPDDRIYGLERKQSKADILKQLLPRHPGQSLRFYEDRLPTLLKINQEAELAEIELFFAAWGYNGALDAEVATAQGFHCQQLDEFLS